MRHVLEIEILYILASEQACFKERLFLKIKMLLRKPFVTIFVFKMKYGYKNIIRSYN